jgi:hypothetical protein
MDNTHLRMIANPYRLGRERPHIQKNTDTCEKAHLEAQLKTQLQASLIAAYPDIYINPLIHEKVYQCIVGIMKDYIIDVVSTETIDCILSRAIRDSLILHETSEITP